MICSIQFILIFTMIATFCCCCCCIGNRQTKVKLNLYIWMTLCHEFRALTMKCYDILDSKALVGDQQSRIDLAHSTWSCLHGMTSEYSALLTIYFFLFLLFSHPILATTGIVVVVSVPPIVRYRLPNSLLLTHTLNVRFSLPREDRNRSRGDKHISNLSTLEQTLCIVFFLLFFGKIIQFHYCDGRERRRERI